MLIRDKNKNIKSVTNVFNFRSSIGRFTNAEIIKMLEKWGYKKKELKSKTKNELAAIYWVERVRDAESSDASDN